MAREIRLRIFRMKEAHEIIKYHVKGRKRRFLIDLYDTIRSITRYQYLKHYSMMIHKHSSFSYQRASKGVQELEKIGLVRRECGQ